MKRLWASRKPINYAGKHYRVNQVIEPPIVQKPHPPFFLGGGSPMAAEMSAQHGSIHLFWGDRPKVVAENVKKIWMLAKKYCREDQILVRHAPAGHLPRQRGRSLGCCQAAD